MNFEPRQPLEARLGVRNELSVAPGRQGITLRR